MANASTGYSVLELTALNNETPAQITAGLKSRLFIHGILTHEAFCPFRKIFLENRARLRRRFPNIHAQTNRFMTSTVRTNDQIYRALRLYPNNDTAENASRNYSIIPTTRGEKVSPTTFVAGDRQGAPLPPNRDLMSGALQDCCFECLSAVKRFNFFPIDKKEEAGNCYNTAGASLFYLAMHKAESDMTDDQLLVMVRHLIRACGAGGSCWDDIWVDPRPAHGAVGLQHLPANTPQFSILDAALSQTWMPPDVTEEFVHWHARTNPMPDANVAVILDSKRRWELTLRVDVFIAMWASNHNASLALGEEDAAAQLDSCWHAIAYNENGVELFDYFKSLAGTPHAARRLPSSPNGFSWETPLRLCVWYNRPDLFARFCHYFPPAGYVRLTPDGLCDLEFVVRSEEPNSPDCLYHILTMPTLMTHMAYSWGSYQEALYYIALGVYNWFYVCEVILETSVLPRWAYLVEPAMGYLRHLAARKLSAVMSHVEAQAFQRSATSTTDLDWRELRIAMDRPRHRFLRGLLRPGIRFHQSRAHYQDYRE